MSQDVPQLTWAVLLGRWIDFARTALALPRTEEGQRLRAAVPDIIMLQAVWFALQHLTELCASERALGLDRAEILIDKHAAVLRDLWAGRLLPEALTELIADARGSLKQARNAQVPPDLSR